MKLRLTCTSYLPERSPVWRRLAEVGEVEVGGYGDWPAALNRVGDEAVLVWLVFLEDLLPWPLFWDEDAKVAEAINIALAALDRRLQSVRTPTIVAWLGWYGESPIRRARNRTARDQALLQFEAELRARVAKYPGLYLLALDALFAYEGMRKCLDTRNFQFSRCRLSLTGLEVLADGLKALVGRLQKPASKVLVLDCDNTLWGGVVGEVGLNGLVLGQDGLGQAYVEFQKAVKTLSTQGVVLALSSKNEATDVWRVFDQHPAMVLRRGDIVASRINWQEKAIQLEELTQDIGVGLDSLVFWDDNPIERQKVRAVLPKVFVPEPPEEVAEWPRTIMSLDALALFARTEDDTRKTAQYRARASFMAEAHRAGGGDAFLKEIGMAPSCLQLDEASLARAAQLCAKTNQFNLRLARHDEAKLAVLKSRPGTEAFLVTLSDKFGDHGICGLAVATATAREDVAFLDTFLMSCRVLGRHLEAWMLEQLRLRLLASGRRYLVAEFIQGERNTPAAAFLSAHGMRPWQENDDFEIPTDLTPGRGQYYWAELQNWRIPHLEFFPS